MNQHVVNHSLPTTPLSGSVSLLDSIEFYRSVIFHLNEYEALDHFQYFETKKDRDEFVRKYNEMVEGRHPSKAMADGVARLKVWSLLSMKLCEDSLLPNYYAWRK